MNSIIENANRIGCFSSSEIWKLMVKGKGTNGFGDRAMTYIYEKNMERKLGRSIRTDTLSRSIHWGNFMEKYVFDNLLGFEYALLSKQTDTHPTIECWVGSKDLIVERVKIGEIKCYEPKNFCEYSDALLSQDTEVIKKQCPEEYWQCVSNAIINQVPNAEGIVYMPYKSELQAIREAADNYDGFDQWKYRFISESEDAALPYLPDGGYYKNLNRFEFTVPQDDIDALTARVLLAETMLIERI